MTYEPMPADVQARLIEKVLKEVRAMRILLVSDVPANSTFRLVNHPDKLYRRIGWKNEDRISCEVINAAGEVCGSVKVRSDAPVTEVKR